MRDELEGGPEEGERGGTSHLFVYGTLRRGAGGPARAPRRLLQEEARLVGHGTLAARLYDAGGFPGAVLEEAGEVRGEVYELSDPASVLPALDRYEGRRPDGGGLFRRERVRVRLESGETVAAWVYLFNRSVEELPEIESGDYLERG